MKCSTHCTINNAFSSLLFPRSSTPFQLLSTTTMPHSLISTFRPPLLRRQPPSTSGQPPTLRPKPISKHSSFLIQSTSRPQDFKIMAKKKPIEGVSDQMNAIASQNLDHAPARRRVRLAFTQVQEQLDHVLFKMAPSGIRTEEWFEMNSKGQEIFCKSWLPKPGVRIKAAVCFVHGYGDTCTFFFEGIAKRIAAAGYGVYAIDHPGFGLSEGLHGYCSNFNDIVDNVIEQYTKIKGRPEVRGMPRFLLAQSMGGAVALKVHLKEQREWDGVALVAPMCKIAEEMKPPEPLQKVLIFLSRIMPKAKLVPTKDLAELAFRDPQKRKLADYNVISYSDQTRLKTAVELLNITNELESEVEKVSAPLLILHGAADKVTDPNISKFLYDKAASKDKTLKLYDGSYHCILEGESDERILEVLGDIIGWLDSHCSIR
ncbi:putative 2-acylglycerol O-acyltransferase [Helianthus annuus]|nr:putative 2-acylglycerol O-acyltransferase [Helianthus annuus]KAJ0865942.1 putative 2-acylglycerol O-acyltransferase [Helianthus annuus]